MDFNTIKLKSADLAIKSVNSADFKTYQLSGDGTVKNIGPSELYATNIDTDTNRLVTDYVSNLGKMGIREVGSDAFHTFLRFQNEEIIVADSLNSAGNGIFDVQTPNIKMSNLNAVSPTIGSFLRAKNANGSLEWITAFNSINGYYFVTTFDEFKYAIEDTTYNNKYILANTAITYFTSSANTMNVYGSCYIDAPIWAILKDTPASDTVTINSTSGAGEIISVSGSLTIPNVRTLVLNNVNLSVRVFGFSGTNPLITLLTVDSTNMTNKSQLMYENLSTPNLEIDPTGTAIVKQNSWSSVNAITHQVECYTAADIIKYLAGVGDYIIQTFETWTTAQIGTSGVINVGFGRKKLVGRSIDIAANVTFTGGGSLEIDYLSAGTSVTLNSQIGMVLNTVVTTNSSTKITCLSTGTSTAPVVKRYNGSGWMDGISVPLQEFTTYTPGELRTILGAFWFSSGPKVINHSGYISTVSTASNASENWIVAGDDPCAAVIKHPSSITFDLSLGRTLRLGIIAPSQGSQIYFDTPIVNVNSGTNASLKGHLILGADFYVRKIANIGAIEFFLSGDSTTPNSKLYFERWNQIPQESLAPPAVYTTRGPITWFNINLDRYKLWWSS